MPVRPHRHLVILPNPHFIRAFSGWVQQAKKIYRVLKMAASMLHRVDIYLNTAIWQRVRHLIRQWSKGINPADARNFASMANIWLFLIPPVRTTAEGCWPARHNLNDHDATAHLDNAATNLTTSGVYEYRARNIFLLKAGIRINADCSIIISAEIV